MRETVEAHHPHMLSDFKHLKMLIKMLFSFMVSRHTGWYLHASKLERGDDQHCPTVRISGIQQAKRWWGHTVHSVVLYSL